MTAHVGKYLNGYKAAADRPATSRRAGTSGTRCSTRGKYVRYYGYQLAVNGELTRVGSKPRDYITRVINRRAARMVRRYAPKRSPLYLQVDHRAPHTEEGVDSGPPCGGLVPPDPRDATAFRDEELPRPASFDEEDVSDKPSFIRELPAPRRGPRRSRSATGAASRRCWRSTGASRRSSPRCGGRTSSTTRS